MARKSKDFIYRPFREADEEPYPDFTLKLHVYASREWDDIIEYIAEHNLSAALKMSAKIYLELRRIEAYPDGYKFGRVEGTREAKVKRYVIVYAIRGTDIVVFCIRHSARRWPEKKLAKLVKAKKLTVVSYKTRSKAHAALIRR